MMSRLRTELPQGLRLEHSVHAVAGLKNLEQLIELRWIAVLGQMVTIIVVGGMMALPIPKDTMLWVVVGLGAFNVLEYLRWHFGREVHQAELFLSFLFDVMVLTVQLGLSGGIGNPFIFLYLLQITLGSVLLRGVYIWSMVGITAACVLLLAQFNRPLPLQADLHQGFASLYVLGLLLCFLLNALLIVIFITRISRNLSQRDARLASARQQAAEKEHIVRMGLLASGAAHELGTPLSTLAVILGDWRRDAQLLQQPGLAQDIAEMETQVQRCKGIVSGILLSAGETRAEASSQTTVCTFVDALAQEWRQTRSISTFVYENEVRPDGPMVSDTTFKQMVFNVLDNAREASPEWVRMRVERDEENLWVRVADAGPGFDPRMLAQLGKPYQSSKESPGRGLGLYLVVNVARTLGGSVAAHNREGGGAEVEIQLPLSAIALNAQDART
jgi:two-component system sensor histidine kinase RegB